MASSGDLWGNMDDPLLRQTYANELVKAGIWLQVGGNYYSSFNQLWDAYFVKWLAYMSTSDSRFRAGMSFGQALEPTTAA